MRAPITAKKPVVRVTNEEAKNKFIQRVVEVWDESHIQAAINVISNESGFDPWVVNQSSHACGLFQALPCEKIGGRVYWDTGLGKWRLDPASISVEAQIEWGINYIKSRYGSPIGAWSWWVSHRWY